MARRLSVVISQGQSSNPAKRQLEEDIVLGLIAEPGIDVTIIPHLYDLQPNTTGHLALRSIPGNLVVLSWLFERAARWTLDRHGIRGKIGAVLLNSLDDDDEEEDPDEEESGDSDEAEIANKKINVMDNRPPINRFIYCLDLRVSPKAKDYVEEIRRLYRESQIEVVPTLMGSLPIVSSPTPAPVTNHNGNGANGNGALATALAVNNVATSDALVELTPATINRIEEEMTRRWYPVIDYSRCTNCMECIDFCLFGVYGIDPLETILVEQPDNCRKGCPACSRVCPENAIMFPQHKTPAIAGSNDSATALKIDLSQLFGAPTEGKSAIELAAAERDEQLVIAGRDAVGLTVGVPKRQAEKSSATRDRLDDLIDELDSMDL